MLVIFVSGPYRTHDAVVKRRYVAQAISVGTELWAKGHVAIIPHINSGPNMEGLVPEQNFLDGYLHLVRRCDAVVVLPGWDRSKGARAEVAEAVTYGIPVFASVEALEVSQVAPRSCGICALWARSSKADGAVDLSAHRGAADGTPPETGRDRP